VKFEKLLRIGSAIVACSLILAGCSHGSASEVLPRTQSATKHKSARPFDVNTNCSHTTTNNGNVTGFLQQTDYSTYSNYGYTIYVPTQTIVGNPGGGVWEVIAYDSSGAIIADSQPQTYLGYQGENTVITVSLPFGLCAMQSVQMSEQATGANNTTVTGQSIDTIYTVSPGPTPQPVTFTDGPNGWTSNHCAVNKFGFVECTQSGGSSPYNVTWTETDPTPTPSPAPSPRPSSCPRTGCLN
jgi:hypothetical protein